MADRCYCNIWTRELKPAEWFLCGSKAWLQRPNFPADFSGAEDYFRVADNPPGISVSLQVEHKQFIGNGQLSGSSLR